MRLQSPWQARLGDEKEGSPCDRLVAALSEDIADGQLEVGARLPAHRDLAWRLGIGVGTVTKAYGVLERRGLVRSVKGRGTFVAVAEARRGAFIDLSRNSPPAVITERLLSRSLVAVSRRVDADVFNSYPPATGHSRFRNEMARWFRRAGMEAEPEHLLLTNGAQHALSISLSVLCGPGGFLYVEEQTYPGVISLARHLGINLVPVLMDTEGMVPDALDQALAERKDTNRAVYLTPTMQNPTTGSMGRARREALAGICQAHGIVVVEDDIYTLCADDDFPPIAAVAPESTFYVNSLSKTLNPALRVGGLVVPRRWLDRAAAALHSSGSMISPLSCAVMEQWLLDGTADAITAAIQEEAVRRRRMAVDILGEAMRRPVHLGYHVWLPLHRGDADALEVAAKALGILVTPASATAAGEGLSGIRLCIGAPTSSDLSTALGGIRTILDRIGTRSDAVVPALL